MRYEEMIRALRLTAACLVLWSLGSIPTVAQQQTAQLGASGVYRIQPSLEAPELVLVPPAEIKAGLTYNYYNERLARRVWGFAKADGSFQFAFGEGTVLPTDRFDLRLSAAVESQLLERGAPGLQQALATTGGRPALRFNAAGRWELLSYRSSARVFDQETGHRWEWHGKRRVAVLHTYGDQWRIVDGRYLPATGPVLILSGCYGPVRAGSAMLVVRTPE
jgi:hypothetical protein